MLCAEGREKSFVPEIDSCGPRIHEPTWLGGITRRSGRPRTAAAYSSGSVRVTSDATDGRQAPRQVQRGLYSSAGADYCLSLGRDEPVGPSAGRPHTIPDTTDPAHGPCVPAELARNLKLTRSNVSNHLACLRNCGITVAVPQGRQTRYEIADPHLRRALNALIETTLAVDEHAPCLDSACSEFACGESKADA